MIEREVIVLHIIIEPTPSPPPPSLSLSHNFPPPQPHLQLLRIPRHRQILYLQRINLHKVDRALPVLRGRGGGGGEEGGYRESEEGEGVGVEEELAEL